jgi:hypothetical protein
MQRIGENFPLVVELVTVGVDVGLAEEDLFHAANERLATAT